MQQDFAARGGDAPGRQDAFLRAVTAQRLVHGVDEQVLHVDIGQAASLKGLKVLPERPGTRTDRSTDNLPASARIKRRASRSATSFVTCRVTRTFAYLGIWPRIPCCNEEVSFSTLRDQLPKNATELGAAIKALSSVDEG